jgi:hypothetical protein
MRPEAVRTTLALALVGSLSVACGSAPPKSPPTGVDELVIPTPSPDPKDFVDRIDNPWLPLEPGNTWVYTSTSEDGDVTITTTVLDQTRVVAGVTATVVHDVETGAKGRVTEDTYDWFAQDRAGNVWYFGEDTTSYDGKLASKEGSWEAGVDGAMAGVVMLASPRLGDGYQQEQLAGVAEDRATVLSLDETVSVPYGDYDGVLLTEETSPLEPAVVEHKYYVSGVGDVREVDVAGGDEVVDLVSFTQS